MPLRWSSSTGCSLIGHMQRHVDDCAGRHNVREFDTAEELHVHGERLEDERPKHDLIDPNGLPSVGCA